MDVADMDEAQSKKVFRARKTMKISDRQQLGSIHNANSSSAVPTSTATASPSTTTPPALLNGKRPEEDERTDRESDTDKTPKGSRPATPVSRTPSPLTLSLSLSPSPPSQSPRPGSDSGARQSPPHSPDRNNTEEDDHLQEKEKEKPSSEEGVKMPEDKKTKGGDQEGKEESGGSEAKDKENENPKPEGDGSPSPNSSISPASPSASEKKEEESKTESNQGTEAEEPMTMDTDLAPTKSKAIDDKMADPPTETTSSTSSSHAPESDLEVKEGFLVLSEEDDNQGEKDQEKEEEKETKDGERMDVDVKKDGDKGGVGDAASPPSPGPAPPLSGDPELEKCQSVLSGKKRALSEDAETDGEKAGEEDGGARDGKRQKTEGEELEAQLELKITANTSSRLKLEKVVQQLVEEQLRVLQLNVFDRSLQELRERVEKIDCATKHQQTLNSLQAKIARLTKKFGAANQTSENMRKGISHANAAPLSTPSSFRSVRTPVESKQTHQNQTTQSVSATASPVQPKPLSTPTAPASSPVVSAPVPLLLTTATTSDSTSLASVSSQNQPGALLLKTTPAGNTVSQSGPAATSQPLLIQLPLAVANGQGGSTGTEVIPASSLGTVGTLNKAKTTSEQTLIVQKATPSSSAPSLPSSPAAPQITVARAVYPPSSGTVSVPSSGTSVSTVRTPSQSASVAGVSSSSSLPATSAPAATGGQAAAGPPSATVMASKTDNQATNSTGNKTCAQASRASGSRGVIDLTEDDDDVQVTGVQKAPVQSGSNAASTSASGTQHSTGGPSPGISSNLSLGSSMRSSPQSGPNGPSLTTHRSPQNSPLNIRAANPNASPHQLPPLPSPPPAPSRLPPEATRTSPPQRPQLKLTRVQNQNGIVLSWGVDEPDRTCAGVDSYHLYAYHRDHGGAPPSQWKKIGEVKALPLPMACTLTQFVAGSTYYFAICARDIYNRFGPFCEPQCTDVINTTSSG